MWSIPHHSSPPLRSLTHLQSPLIRVGRRRPGGSAGAGDGDDGDDGLDDSAAVGAEGAAGAAAAALDRAKTKVPTAPLSCRTTT